MGINTVGVTPRVRHPEQNEGSPESGFVPVSQDDVPGALPKNYD